LARINETVFQSTQWRNIFLSTAIILGDTKEVTYLVSKGGNAENEYAFKMCAELGLEESVKNFIKIGTNVHAENEYALRISAKNGYEKIVEYLVSAGANLDVAIEHCNDEKTKNILRKYIER
jgi:hypothetical protein